MYGTSFSHRARMRVLGRPVTAGLLLCAGILPLPQDAAPTLTVRNDAVAAKPQTAKRRTPPVQTMSHAPEPMVPPVRFGAPPPPVPEHTDTAIELAALPSPAPEQQAPVVLIVATAPPEPPFVKAPAQPELSLTADALALEPAPVDVDVAMAPPLPVQAEPPVVSEHAAAAPNLPEVPIVLAVATVPGQPVLVTPPPIPSAEPSPLRRVDIAQIQPSTPGIRVPQLNEPGLVPGGPNLADKTAAMQVTLPPPARPSAQELAWLQADAPAELTVRLGSEAVGKVAFRMGENRSIDVQLSGLLDILADRFAAEDFARLRSSAAADSFVPLDSLRSIGLSLRYDPVYDELRIAA